MLLVLIELDSETVVCCAARSDAGRGWTCGKDASDRRPEAWLRYWAYADANLSKSAEPKDLATLSLSPYTLLVVFRSLNPRSFAPGYVSGMDLYEGCCGGRGRQQVLPRSGSCLTVWCFQTVDDFLKFHVAARFRLLLERCRQWMDEVEVLRGRKAKVEVATRPKQ